MFHNVHLREIPQKLLLLMGMATYDPTSKACTNFKLGVLRKELCVNSSLHYQAEWGTYQKYLSQSFYFLVKNDHFSRIDI
jgi:hypothetical protein